MCIDAVLAQQTLKTVAAKKNDSLDAASLAQLTRNGFTGKFM
jgi:hypothetical protein